MCVSFKQPLDSLRLLLAVLQLVALLFEESVIKSQIIFFFLCRIFDRRAKCLTIPSIQK